MCLGYRLCPCRLKLMLRLLVTGKGGLYRGCYFLPWWAPRERVFIINMSSFKQQVGFLDVKHERACLLLLETTRLFSKVAIPFCIPISNEWEFILLHILASVCSCQYSRYFAILIDVWASLDSSAVKNPPANAGDTDLIPESGRSPGGGNGNPLQYPCLENSMVKGAWWAKSMRYQRVRHDWAHTHYRFVVASHSCFNLHFPEDLWYGNFFQYYLLSVYFLWWGEFYGLWIT